MTKEIFESKTNRKTVFKTESGIEIKRMLHQKKGNETNSTNITFYYVFHNEKNGNYNVYTNPKLFGETKIIDTFTSKENAIRTAKAINKSMKLLFENII
jgi:hypothetical protein